MAPGQLASYMPLAVPWPVNLILGMLGLDGMKPLSTEGRIKGTLPYRKLAK
jgi:hypothetical protein